MKLTLALHSLTLTASLALPAALMASGPGTTNDFGGRRVLYIGIDGVRPDALQAANTPNMDALAAEGVITYNAFSGGVLGTSSQQSTYSGPGWSSLLTGVWTDKHKVTNNSFTGHDFQNYPHFFRRIKEEVPTAHVSSIIHWSPIDTVIVEGSKDGGVEFVDFRSNQSTDTGVANVAAAQLGSSDPDVMFLHFDEVDYAGHGYGYSTSVPEYLSAIEGVDGYIGTVLTALQNRPQYAQEDWLVIVSTDHGGTGTGHGGQTSGERTIFMLVSGGATENGVVSTESPGQPAAPATAMKHLGITLDPSWGWEEDAFGLPAPRFEAEVAGDYALLHWDLPEGGLSGLTGFELLRDGVSIATLGLEVRSYTDSPVVPVSGGVQYSYSLRFTGSSEPDQSEQLTLGTGDNVSDLEMYLTFDEVTEDASGKGHHATAVGAPSYVDGVSGKAAVLDSGRYFTVPQTGGLLFGSTTDFTVSFWIKSSGQWSGDPSFVSNKDWDSGANQGWIVAGQANGPAWQWNLKGDAASRRDFDNGGLVQDGRWHHILVSHDRDGSASFYQDGEWIGSVSIANDGSVDTGFPLVIGRDGELDYGFNQELYIDEVKIWRRALSEIDVKAEVAGRSDYFVWQENQFSEAQLVDPQVSGNDADPDLDGMNNALEFALGRNPLVVDAATVLQLEQVDGEWIVSWPQRSGGTGIIGVDYQVSGIAYQLEASASLGGWQSGASVIHPHGGPRYLQPGWHKASAKLLTPSSVDSFFYQLKVDK
ncbi:hypothetical protein Rhal01_01954 [Rubritalea halochordaticola]|uniref:LamG-like jellyroll fold domain-containing protein n=1 Tax=Rubritalea halochordaticola TaxID=714537 RepID=A0ABP9V1C2_9BACT